MRTTILRQIQPVRAMAVRPAPSLLARSTLRPAVAIAQMKPIQIAQMHASRNLRMPVPKEEHSAHTISQRLRTLKKIPAELLPLAFVIIAALLAAVYSMVHKLFSDKTLRLSRQGAIAPGPPKNGDH